MNKLFGLLILIVGLVGSFTSFGKDYLIVFVIISIIGLIITWQVERR